MLWRSFEPTPNLRKSTARPCACPGPAVAGGKALKRARGFRPNREVHGSAAHGEVDRSRFTISSFGSILQNMSLRFRVLIEQDEDGVFVAECPTLPGCISQGKTRQDALANIQDAIKGYLASLEKHGELILSHCS